MTIARLQFHVVANLRSPSFASSRLSGAAGGHRPAAAVGTGTAGGGASGGGGLGATAQCLDELAAEVVVQPAIQQRIEARRAKNEQMTDWIRYAADLHRYTIQSSV